MQFLELKSAIAKAKISPELFNSIFEQAEERMRNLHVSVAKICPPHPKLFPETKLWKYSCLVKEFAQALGF